jgi:hypothetical protein
MWVHMRCMRTAPSDADPPVHEDHVMLSLSVVPYLTVAVGDPASRSFSGDQIWRTIISEPEVVTERLKG